MKKEFIIFFDSQEISFCKEKWNIIIGPVGSGKTIFLKNISSPMNTSTYFPQENVIYISDNESYPQDKMIERILMDMNHQQQISEVLKLFGIQDLSVFFNHKKSTGIYQLLTFLYRYLEDPTVLILDQSFSMIDAYHRRELLKWLKKDTKKRKITVIYATMSPEELLLGDMVSLWFRQKELLSGTCKQVLKEDEVFRKTGLEMPFVMELYHKLKYYDVIDHPVYDLEKMVDALWK